MILKNRDLSQYKDVLDQAYSRYDFESRPWGYKRAYINWVRDAICEPVYKNLKKGSVLDAGGGFGYFRKFTNCFHVNIDLSFNIIKYDNSPFKTIGAVEELPFSDKSFDNIVTIGVLRHCCSPSKFIDESYRVLKSGGLFLVTTPSADWPGNLNKTVWCFFTVLSKIQMLFSVFKEKYITFKSNGAIKDSKMINSGVVYDRRFLSDQLQEILKKKFTILEKGRSGRDFPSFLHPPKFLVEKYFNSNKYGRFLYFICLKE